MRYRFHGQQWRYALGAFPEVSLAEAMTATTLDTISTDTLLADIAALRNESQSTLAAMLDPLDLPGSMTEREKQHDRERRVRLQQHISWCNKVAEQLAKAATTCATLTPARDRLLSARATIAQQFEEAPDHRTIVDARAQRHEWERQNALAASLTAIARGVEYFNGHPALPTPLRELLTDVCPHCNHGELLWLGPLSELEGKIAKAKAVIAAAPNTLASIRASVAPWLTETVSR